MSGNPLTNAVNQDRWALLGLDRPSTPRSAVPPLSQLTNQVVNIQNNGKTATLGLRPNVRAWGEDGPRMSPLTPMFLPKNRVPRDEGEIFAGRSRTL